MKAAIFLATHNKNEALANVFHSITRQKTSFPFEVVIVDDASDDVSGLIEAGARHLEGSGIPYKVMLLSKNVGPGRAQSFCLDLVSEDVDTIVLQSADVLYAGEYVLEKLCRNTAPGRFTLAEVRNVSVDPEMWRSFDENLPFYLENERIFETLAYINSDPKQPDRGNYTIHHVFYSGTRQPRPLERWYFFLGAIRKDDLLETCFAMNCMDKAISNDLHRLGKECVYVDAIGIHQRHPV